MQDLGQNTATQSSRWFFIYFLSIELWLSQFAGSLQRITWVKDHSHSVFKMQLFCFREKNNFKISMYLYQLGHRPEDGPWHFFVSVIGVDHWDTSYLGWWQISFNIFCNQFNGKLLLADNTFKISKKAILFWGKINASLEL